MAMMEGHIYSGWITPFSSVRRSEQPLNGSEPSHDTHAPCLCGKRCFTSYCLLDRSESELHARPSKDATTQIRRLCLTVHLKKTYPDQLELNLKMNWSSSSIANQISDRTSLSQLPLAGVLKRRRNNHHINCVWQPISSARTNLNITLSSDRIIAYETFHYLFVRLLKMVQMRI